MMEQINAREKKEVVYNILNSLPEWFGIEESINEYAEKSGQQLMLRIVEDKNTRGFITLEQHSPDSLEIYCMGIDPSFHRKGFGRQLIEKAEKFCHTKNISFLTVKTLSGKRENEYYERTRCFYQAMGFKILEEISTLWGEENPCLLLIKWMGK